ncbi:MAG: hypothetical protein PVJ86_05195 [Phycisphaerales bacterium]
MESKITRYSAAAIIALAIAFVLLSPFGTSDSGGIVWAEVVRKLDKAPTCIHRMNRVCWRLGEEEPFIEVDVKKYVSADLGIVEEQYNDEGSLMHRVYFLAKQQEIILVFPSTKKYLKIANTGDFFGELTKLLTPRGLVDYITSGEHTELGRSQFDGFDVYGFETNGIDLSNIPDQLQSIIPVKSLTGRLWIDAETSLPVGVEMELTTDRGLLTGFQKLRAKFRGYDFQWNADIPEGIFDPNIPDDYTEIKATDFIPVKAGLVGFGIIPAGFIFWKMRRRKREAASRN